MLPLRLAGVSMADEASKSLGGGARNYLGTLGSILPLVGLEEFVRSLVSDQPALPHWASFILIVTGLPLYVAPWAWDRLQRFVGREEATKSLEYLSNRDSDFDIEGASALRRPAERRVMLLALFAPKMQSQLDERCLGRSGRPHASANRRLGRKTYRFRLFDGTSHKCAVPRIS
jgi:hypothetical protein